MNKRNTIFLLPFFFGLAFLAFFIPKDNIEKTQENNNSTPESNQLIYEKKIILEKSRVHPNALEDKKKLNAQKILDIQKIIDFSDNQMGRTEKIEKLKVFLSSSEKVVRLAALDAIGILNPIEETESLIALFNDKNTSNEEKFKILSALNNGFLISEQEITTSKISKNDLDKWREDIGLQISDIITKKESIEPINDLALQISASTLSDADKIKISGDILNRNTNRTEAEIDFLVNASIFSDEGQKKILPLVTDKYTDDVMMKYLIATQQPFLVSKLSKDSKIIITNFIEKNKNYFLNQGDHVDFKNIIEISIKNLK